VVGVSQLVGSEARRDLRQAPMMLSAGQVLCDILQLHRPVGLMPGDALGIQGTHQASIARLELRRVLRVGGIAVGHGLDEATSSQASLMGWETFVRGHIHHALTDAILAKRATTARDDSAAIAGARARLQALPLGDERILRRGSWIHPVTVYV
jgi:hypothetical protein